jgi:para-aminobenzoate synthetase/4-amino-4-deoxychorismate lyase
MMTVATPQYPTVLLESFSSGQNPCSYRFDGLESVVTALTPDEIVPALQEVERAVERGLHAAGFVGYEAAAALNPDLAAEEQSEVPLVWFGIFRERHECTAGAELAEQDDCGITPLETAIGLTDYNNAIAAIRKAIARGETYQVNFTTRQRFGFKGDPFALYRRMCKNQQAPFCAWIDTGTHRILSASPELFFSLDHDTLTMRPMKGTAPRLPSTEADRAQREQLVASAKERAENLMIVDLVRNDLALIAESGSIEVPDLFHVETYPTLHQMTSTVTGRIRKDVGLIDIFRALFPCGSVTGAPKRRTMEIIRDLEKGPRGIYCGAIGFVSPGREACFSVAIRTVVLDMAPGTGEIGIGSGITWDSVAENEYRECLAKSAFISRESGAFQLIETLRHDHDGYLLLDRHLHRLAGSAARFGFKFDADVLRSRLDSLSRELNGVHKVRVLLAADGDLTVEAELLATPDCQAAPGLIMVAQQRVDSTKPLLYHKTTRRELYDLERKRHPECFDVIFLNKREELTEGSYNNIVVSLGGELLTPEVSCGLLPGVLREELLDVGAIREAVLTLDDLHAADTIWMINSVRGWRECQIVS